MRLTALSLALMASTAVMPQAMAQDSEEDDVIVVTSTRRVATPITEVTRSVSVITQDMIDIQGDLDRTAGSILAQTVPGFSPSTQALTNYTQTLRGRNFQTLIDGVPQDTPLRNGFRTLQSIDVDAVEQIEVVRGGTAVYGFGADGGLINYITKRPEDGEFNASARAGFSFSTEHPDDSLEFNTNLTASGRSGETDYLVSGTFVNRNGTFDAEGNRRPVDPVGAQGGLDESDSVNVLAKLGHEFGGNQRLEGTVNYFSLRQNADFGDRLSANTPSDFGPPTRPEIALPGETQDEDPGNEGLNAYLTYNNEDFFGSALEVQGFYQQIDTIFTLFPGFAQTEVESEKFGLRVTGTTPVAFEQLPFDLIWGVDYLADETSQFEVTGANEAPVGDQDALAGFAQVEVPLGERAIVTAGVRHEDVTIDVTGVTPEGELSGSETLFNASASIFLTETFTLFGGVSESFSPGDILRVLTDGSFATADDVELEFVETQNYEMGLRAQTERFRGELVGFYSESNNGTSYDADLNILTRPEEIQGIEASAAFDVTDSFELGATYSLVDGEVDVDNDGSFDEDLPTTRIPPEKVTAFGNWAVTDDWNIVGQVFYSGEQSNDSSAFGGGQDIDSYVLVDLRTSFTAGPGELSLGLTNLLNNEYLPVINQAFNAQYANVQGPGRRLSAAYRMEF